ncbi:F-box domain [Lasallia pustulata]|uniref:F-box domain n=1 Tax=Lasallia pustulata TaxID=136370 RepID=A0A1W5D534_9LECA|nr:F-box domain [Lasallia pustulata]
MGTRGFRIIHFRGRYYILYNHWDSYPEGMGQWLVDQIPQDPDEYQLWLQQQRDFYAKWDEVLRKEVLSIKDADLQAKSRGPRRYDEPRQQALLDERLDASMVPCYRTGFNDLYIEWTYTIDLDREVFSINNGVHFKLNKIPEDDWDKAVGFDSDSGRFILPSLVPADSLASLASQSKDPCHSSRLWSIAYEKLVPQPVRPKGDTGFDPMISHGPAILSNLWLNFRDKLEPEMPYVLRGLSPDDFAFREIAFAIIALAAGLTDTLTVVDARRLTGDLANGYVGILNDDDVNAPVAFAAELGVGCHLEGFQPGSAPSASSYWFRGVLVRLECPLDQPDAVQQAIVLAVECGRRESQAPNFDAIVLSIEHAVILRVFPDHIEHTGLLSLLEIPIHYTKSSLDRYPPEVMNELEGLQEPTQLETPADDVDVSPKKRASCTRSDKTEPSTTYDDPSAFMALIHCFEATTVRSLSRTFENDSRLPVELYEAILDHVDDETYWACSKVSRSFRRYCLKNLRLIKNTVARRAHFPMTAQPPKTQDCDSATLTFGLFDAVTGSTVASQVERGVVSEVPTYSRYSRKKQKEQSTVWQVLVGRPPTMSLVVRFVLSNLHAQVHWRRPEAVRIPSPRRMVIPSVDMDSELGLYGHYWNSISVMESVNAINLSSNAVLRIWEAILPSYKIRLGTNKDSAWTYPPNTKYGYVDIEGTRNEQWLMYIIVKRSSATTQPSEVWERALEEAETDVEKWSSLLRRKADCV